MCMLPVKRLHEQLRVQCGCLVEIVWMWLDGIRGYGATIPPVCIKIRSQKVFIRQQLHAWAQNMCHSAAWACDWLLRRGQVGSGLVGAFRRV